MVDISFKQLESFVAVCQKGSFSKAAEELFLSQSTISTHINNLELALNSRLFYRKPGNKPVLTPKGEKVFLEAKIILDRLNAISRVNEDETRLSLGASTVPGQYLLPTLTASFHEVFPKCTFKIRGGNSGQVFKLLKSGEISLGIVGEKEEEKEFSYELLCRDRFVVICPNREPFSSLPKSSGKEIILKEPFLVREGSSGTRKYLETYLKKIGSSMESLNIVGEYDDSESIKLSAMGNMGVSLLSVLSVREEIKSGKLLSFDLGEEESFRDIYFVYKKDHFLLPMEEKFVKFSLEKVREILK